MSELESSMSESESSMSQTYAYLFNLVMRDDWDKVIEEYESRDAQRARITTSGHTVLHLAVSDGKEDIVGKLIDVIVKSTLNKGIAPQDEEGDTPLHIAALMGNVRMCELFTNVDPTLIGIQNKYGETPLFLAALHGKKDAFLCLNSKSPPDLGNSYCRRRDGNNILHCAIDGEYFDLAFQINHLYKDLANCVNSEGFTPLHVLATKPSAFKSGSELGRFQKMVYKILSVKKLKVDKTYQEKEESIKNEPNPSCPQTYTRKGDEEEIDTIENPKVGQEGDQPDLETREKDFLSPYFVTCFEFVKVAFKAMLFIITGPGYGGVTNILEEKRKHTWSVQVLDKLLEETDMYKYDNAGLEFSTVKKNEALTLEIPEEDGKKTKVLRPITTKKDSVILIAAQYRITEIVKKILKKFPIAIHETEEDKKNIVLVALENRSLKVYKLLLKKYGQNESIFRKFDKDGNGALHFAATFKEEHPAWPIPGDALQMQWEIKWLKFVEASKPKHFFVRYNKENKTPDQIFTKTHKQLVQNGGEWMKKTAESCSLVAALIATVAFASSTSLPGGFDDKSGKPHLETKPGFQVFAISSLIALCFSVTSLVMFLAILTSRYQEKDFSRNLPWKLLLGLTSLFVSIASMLVSFCAGHFFVLEDTISSYIAFPVYALTGVPVTFFAAAQFPLYFDLIRATFRSPFGDPTKLSKSGH